MALRRFLLSVPLLLMLTCLPSMASGAESLTWATPDWPPYYIINGDDKGKGYSDVFRNFFAQRLPQYNQKSEVMTISRFYLSAKQGKTVCFCDLLKNPEREKILLYSDPMVLAPGLRIYSLPNGKINPGNRKSISLERLLSDPELQTALEKGRSYGEKLDAIIDTCRNNENVRDEQITPERVLQLLENRRIDYFIEYPFALATTQQRLESATSLVSTRIDEQFPYTVAYVTCSKTPTGKRIIADVNAILRKEKGSEEYKRIFMLPTRIMGESGKREYSELWDIFQDMNQ